MTVAIAISYWRKSETYTLGVLAAFLLVIPTAHLGATLTHGEGFLTEPWEAAFADKQQSSEPALVGVEATPEGADGQGKTKVEPSETGDNPGDVAGAADLPSDALTEPTKGSLQVGQEAKPISTQEVEPSLVLAYADIAPIFKDYCIKCHGTRKRKGDLALHSLESILAGGEHGAVLIPGDPLNSKLITSLSEPLESDHHMPPEGKKQPSADAIAQLTLWVQGMESTTSSEAALEAETEPAPGNAEPVEGAHEPALPKSTSFAPTAPSAGAVEALVAHQVHVATLGQDTNLLEVDFTSASLGGESITSLLAPVAGLVGELCLFAQTPTQQDLLLLGSMPRLAHLDLRSAGDKPLSIAPLGSSTSITSLNLSSTPLASSSWSAIAKMESLNRVHIWGTGISEADLDKLAEQRPKLRLLGWKIEGDSAIEVEPEVDFTKFVPETDSDGAGTKEAPVTADAAPGLRQARPAGFHRGPRGPHDWLLLRELPEVFPSRPRQVPCDSGQRIALPPSKTQACLLPSNLSFKASSWPHS